MFLSKFKGGIEMTAYQVIRAIQEGKGIYRVERNGEIRFVWAFSLENAKSKFPKWAVSEYARLTICIRGELNGKII
jgi:hypothetical protein